MFRLTIQISQLSTTLIYLYFTSTHGIVLHKIFFKNVITVIHSFKKIYKASKHKALYHTRNMK